jgi:hypothetical protein
VQGKSQCRENNRRTHAVIVSWYQTWVRRPGRFTLRVMLLHKGVLCGTRQRRWLGDNLCVPGFIFLRTTEVRLAPEHRAQYLTIREVVKWEITDETGDYSGFLIAGEQIIGIHPPPQGFVPSANLTFAWQRQERT